MRTAWALNLDADVELAAAARGAARYAPTDTVRAAMAPHVAKLAAGLLGAADVLVDETSAPGCARGFVGRAFCPTPRAIALLERAGADVAPHPALEVLREVNGRAFCAGLGQTLSDARFVRDLHEAEAVLSRQPSVAEQWRVKRAFGMAGRGQRTAFSGAHAIDAALRAFLRAGMSEGGVQIEPNLAIERELALHGILEVDGSFRLGELVSQECDPRGQWLSSVRAEEVEAVFAGAIVR
jgi:hypothetical protein